MTATAPDVPLSASAQTVGTTVGNMMSVTNYVMGTNPTVFGYVDVETPFYDVGGMVSVSPNNGVQASVISTAPAGSEAAFRGEAPLTGQDFPSSITFVPILDTGMGMYVDSQGNVGFYVGTPFVGVGIEP